MCHVNKYLNYKFYAWNAHVSINYYLFLCDWKEEVWKNILFSILSNKNRIPKTKLMYMKSKKFQHSGWIVIRSNLIRKKKFDAMKEEKIHITCECVRIVSHLKTHISSPFSCVSVVLCIFWLIRMIQRRRHEIDHVRRRIEVSR